MKNIDFDKTLIGALFGLFAPFIAFVGYYLINFRFLSIRKFINYMQLGDIYTPVITLCVLANLVLFYLFINKEKYKATRGVIASTFIWAGIVVFLKFYT